MESNNDNICEQLIISKKRKYIWGAGKFGVISASYFMEKGILIDGYIDSNPNLEGNKIYENLICEQPRQNYCDSLCIIVVSEKVNEEVKKQARKKGFDRIYDLNIGELQIYLKSLNDEKFLVLMYQIFFGKKLDLENPSTFTEKIQWIKIHDRNPEYSKLVDKFSVREYVKEKIGNQYLPTLYGIYDSISQIDTNQLPDEFVLKTTHDSGGLFICKDKKNTNIEQNMHMLEQRLQYQHYYLFREFHYKNIVPRLICEEFLKDELYIELPDYKLFCFNSKVRLIQVDIDRFSEHKRNFYDINWNFLEVICTFPNFKNNLEKPEALMEMISCAEKLAENILFCRVDFYLVNNKIYFGEMTFYPGGGFEKFSSGQFDKLLGDMLEVKELDKIK